MEALADILTKYCLQKNLINTNQVEWCHYMIVHRAMNIISLLWLVPLGALFSTWYVSLAFVLSYRFLRARTGGYHAKTPLGCILSSTILQLTGVYLVINFEITIFLIILFVFSSVIIVMLAPANNANLHLTPLEIQALKPRIKIRLVILLFILIIFGFILPEITVCIILGVVVTAALLFISKMGLGAQ